ncbi:hypothetical protein K469DRAFT_660153 [Zopfia rhizophila CBS 207.26]|uniref:F-box domain-containing protein n=1 Tax=Zopfia rhizophila CBS 207.26 TaxID=1314779 RepID=A0A6A6EF03_9PEZI|nr:hypothetical protein K469DRAFT_660153 [Zopfia rhizophila CBS 207.26]
MHRYNRQSHLGPSPNKVLTIVDVELLRPQPRLQVIGPTFIFRLPDELLVSIIELAVFEEYSWHGCSACRVHPNAKSAKALSRVCRRISSIAQPMLFHTIKFEGTPSTVPPKKPVIRLYHALRKNPSLRQHCKCLSIGVSDIPPATKTEDYAVASDLAQWLTGVRCLENYGGFEGPNVHTWSLIRNLARNMRDVQHWRLCREGWGLYLHQVVKEVTFPKLAKLELHGISEWKTHSLQLDAKTLRTAPLTSLSMSDYEETPLSTALFLQWPAALEHFVFSSFYNNRSTMTYPMFQSWLSIQRETLRSIDIGYLSGDGDNNKHIFDATIFPHLESLGLSRWQMGHSGALLPFTAENASLLGPKVKHFKWCFHIYDQHSESWEDFGEKEEAWVRELGKAAIARKSLLETIEIQFRPDDWNAVGKDEYPWDWMDHIRDELLRPNRMNLIYGMPPMAKEEWLTGREERAARGPADEMECYEDVTEMAAEIETETENKIRAQTPPGYHGRDIREYFGCLKSDAAVLNA